MDKKRKKAKPVKAWAIVERYGHRNAYQRFVTNGVGGVMLWAKPSGKDGASEVTFSNGTDRIARVLIKEI